MSTFIDNWFEDGVSDEQTNKPDKPLWKILKDDVSDSELHKWLMGEMAWLKQINRERIQKIHRNLALFKGIQYQSQNIKSDLRDTEIDKSRVVQKIVSNQIKDLVQTRVAKLIRYKPAVAILPTNDEYSDKISAKVSEFVLSHIWYNEQFQSHKQLELVKLSKTMGEGFVFVDYDWDRGDVHPDYVAKYAAKVEAGERVPLLADDGSPVLKDGKPVFVDAPIMTGDVSYRIKMATEVLVQRKERWVLVEHVIERDLMDIEEAKLRYPNAIQHIKDTDRASVYDYETMAEKRAPGVVPIYKLWAKRTGLLPQGALITFTGDGILDRAAIPFKHRSLPCVRLTDIDVPGELHGRSMIDDIKPITGAYNNLTNMILRNQILCAHPKWVMPAGSAKLESLGNDITIVQYKGPIAPQLIQGSPTSPEVFNFRKELKEEAMQLAQVFGMSRGSPPPGIKAAIALQFMSEQENERQNEDVLKYNEFLCEVARLTLAVAGQFYDDDDKRMVRVLGKNNRWMTVPFKTADLTKNYDIRVQNSSALPESKAARIEYLLELKKSFPAAIPDDQVLDMLDLAQEEKFIDLATRSVRAAEAEVEQIMNGNAHVEPQEWEDHVVHWRVKVGALREWAFKNMTPKPVQQRLIDVITTHEMFMVEKAKLNPSYTQQLATLPGFPLFYTELGIMGGGAVSNDPEANVPRGTLGMAAAAAMTPPVGAELAAPEVTNPALAPVPPPPINPDQPSMDTQSGMDLVPQPQPPQPSGSV